METPLKIVLGAKALLLAERGGALYTTRPEIPASEAIRTMCEQNVGCVLVIDNARLTGILSERDVLRRIVDKGINPADVAVGDVMTKNVFTVEPSLTVEEALAECTNRRIRHLPVIGDGELLGLLSIGDLVRFALDDKDHDIADLMRYIHGQQIEI